MSHDVVIIGGGPAGLSAALVFARARKRVLLCDGGTPRNATAAHIHGFVTQDGTPPAEFRRIAGEQLAAYPNLEQRRGAIIEDIRGEAGALRVMIDGVEEETRRAIVCTGMIDELPELPGYRELWGKAIFQCPYCHGWEVRDQPLGYLVPAVSALPLEMRLEFALFLRNWSQDLVVFTDGAVEVSAEVRSRYAAAGLRIEERPVRKMIASGDGEHLAAVELADGTQVARVAMFARPTQRQVPLVTKIGLELDEHGFVRTVEPLRTTSRSGIHAAGDLTTMMQGALLAAAAGAQVAYALNHALSMEH
jgi:thioredoxin reductase